MQTAQIAAATTADRLEVLDGMRGVAALMVVAFHFMARWTEQIHGHSLYPYGDIFLDAFDPLRYFGTIGVQLFFLISGFVIMMTLQRCSGLLDFAGRRFARLWPTMLVCATLTTLLVNGTAIHERLPGTAYWEVRPLEYIFSIMFIDPGLVGRVAGIDGLRWVDGVYWTLGAEVRFYLLICLTFWLLPRRYFLWGWVALQALSTSAEFLRAYGGLDDFPLGLSLIVQPGLLAWFTLGICGYQYREGRASLPVLIAAGLALTDILVGPIIDLRSGIEPGALTWIAIYTAIIAPFALFLIRSRVLAPLASPGFVAIGLASYPLYLFHERVGIITTTYLTQWGVPPLVAMAVTLCALIGFAIFLSRLVEYPAKRLITRYWMPLSDRLQARYPALAFRR